MRSQIWFHDPSDPGDTASTIDRYTIVDDFARAQSLTTDGYRPQLVAQQQSVQKSGVVSNEYWAVSSAVLSVSADQAAMLLALQGQRGADPKNVKFITATVRVDFVKNGDQWQVQNLSVLSRPYTAAADAGGGG